jgi:hypothetical protein
MEQSFADPRARGAVQVLKDSCPAREVVLELEPHLRQALEAVRLPTNLREGEPPASAPVVGHDAAGRPELCFAAYRLIEAARPAVARRLEPEPALFLDNHRMVHGRRAISPDSPRRLRRLWIRTRPGGATRRLRRARRSAALDRFLIPGYWGP